MSCLDSLQGVHLADGVHIFNGGKHSLNAQRVDEIGDFVNRALPLHFQRIVGSQSLCGLAGWCHLGVGLWHQGGIREQIGNQSVAVGCLAPVHISGGCQRGDVCHRIGVSIRNAHAVHRCVRIVACPRLAVLAADVVTQQPCVGQTVHTGPAPQVL